MVAPQVVLTRHGRVEVVDTGGSGPVLLAIHGMPGDWRQALPLADDLAPAARVLFVSRPGYGRTPLSSGRTPAEQAALYLALLDSLRIDRVVAIGISGGGPSAFALATLAPARTCGLLLCCPVRSGVIEAPAVMRRLAAVPGVWSAVCGLARAVDAVRRSTGRTASPDLSSLTEEESARLAQPEVLDAATRFAAHRGSTLRGRGLRNDVRMLGTVPPVWPAGAAIPTVVMHGDLDTVVPLANGEAYADVIPGARLSVLPGLGHAVPIFARTQLAGELRSLLAAP